MGRRAALLARSSSTGKHVAEIPQRIQLRSNRASQDFWVMPWHISSAQRVCASRCATSGIGREAVNSYCQLRLAVGHPGDYQKRMPLASGDQKNAMSVRGPPVAVEGSAWVKGA